MCPVPTLPKPKYDDVGVITTNPNYWAFYPTSRTQHENEVTYHKWMSSKDYPLFLENGVQLKFLPSWALNDLKLVYTNLISNSHILTKRDKNNQPMKYPVVIFSHGLKGAPPMYVTIAQEIATRGFVVFSVYHSDGSSYLNFDASIKIDDHLKRNFQVNVRANDIIKVLDELEKLDLNRIALVGHSFGSASICKTAIKDKRISCILGLDPWLFPLSESDFEIGLNIPTIFIASHEWQWTENIERMRKICQKNEFNGQIIFMKNIQHLNFSDSPYLAPQFLLKKMGLIGETDRDHAIEKLGVLMAYALTCQLNLQGECYDKYIAMGEELIDSNATKALLIVEKISPVK